MRLLTRNDVKSLISMREVIDIMREVFALVSERRVVMPDRTTLEVEEQGGSVLLMPGYIPASGGIGTKIVSFFPRNAAQHLPTISALIVLNDPKTGVATCVMDGTEITALRTGAASGLATEMLARKDASVLGIFGSGVQARTQIAAVLEVRPIKTVKIYDLRPQDSRRLADEMGAQWPGRMFQAVSKPSEAVQGSDIIITATTSETPVFDGALLEEGAHVNSIGSFKPHVREVDDTTIRRSKIVVDLVDAALNEAGDLIIPLKAGVINERSIHAELGEIVLGRKEGRGSPREITYFKSVGLAVQDVAVAQRIYEKAIQQNVGSDV